MGAATLGELLGSRIHGGFAQGGALAGNGILLVIVASYWMGCGNVGLLGVPGIHQDFRTGESIGMVLLFAMPGDKVGLDGDVRMCEGMEGGTCFCVRIHSTIRGTLEDTWGGHRTGPNNHVDTGSGDFFNRYCSTDGDASLEPRLDSPGGPTYFGRAASGFGHDESGVFDGGSVGVAGRVRGAVSSVGGSA